MTTPSPRPRFGVAFGLPSGLPLAVIGVLAATVLVQTMLIGSARKIDSCASPGRLADLSSLPASVGVDAKADDEDGEIFWRVAGELAIAPTHLSFIVARSHEVSSTATNWTRLLRHPMDPREPTRERIDVDGEPFVLQWSNDRTDQTVHFSGRLQFVGRRATDSPLRTLLATVLPQLRHGSEPLTLYLVEGVTVEDRLSLRRAQARDWLIAGARHFRAACGPQR